MAIMETRIRLLEDGQAVEVAISANETQGVARSYLNVPEGCPALAITVTAGGPDNFRHGPRGASVKVQTPSGRNISEEFVRCSNGQQTYILREPEPGSWEILIQYDRDCDVEVNASALPRGWRERLSRVARWLSCKACKYAIKAFVIALLAQLGPFAAAALAAGNIPELALDALDALSEALDLVGSAHEEFRSFLSTLVDNPIDRILTRICAWIHLCNA